MRSPFALLAIAALGLWPIGAVAAEINFPYEATVETDKAPVRSGPGEPYYATQMLSRGSRVMVHRHDPGGWYMIAPPPSSYSLIRSDAVHTVGDSLEVVSGEASVRVGSLQNVQNDVEQVVLTRGTRLQKIPGQNAPAGWIAIVPPRGEYRWIAGQYLVPVSETTRVAQDRDPYAVPSRASRSIRSEDVQIAKVSSQNVAGPFAKNTEKEANTTPDAAEPPLLLPPAADQPAVVVNSAEPSLRKLDEQLAALDSQEPTTWQLTRLEESYRSLREQSAPGERRAIDVRLVQLARLRVVQNEYRGYIELVSNTDERDAALIARQTTTTPTVSAREPAVSVVGPLLPIRQAENAKSAQAGPTLLGPDLKPSETKPPAAPQLASAQPSSGLLRGTQPVPPPTATPRVLAPAPPAESKSSMSQPTTPVAPRRFTAVGIVQTANNAQPGLPGFVLVAQNGRILLHLQSGPGLALERFVGRAVGVDGQMLQHPQLGSQILVVQQLTPVQF